MINDTKTIEKCKVNNCNLINVKEEFLIKIVVLILRLLLKYSNKDTSRLSRKVEKCINNILANNNDISRTINEKVIILDDKLIEKTILGCAILCKGSIRNTKEFLKNIYNYNCSTGKISNIITKYSVKARQYNESIDLSKITIGANDEIFQASKPVLVGVEPFSNYIYLMELEEKRDGITWWYHLEQKSIEQGLNLVKSVNDAGKGLNNGIKLSFDSKCQIWVDVFHSERNFSKGLTSLQNRAYSKIKEEYRNKKLYLKSKIDEKEYNDIVDESNKAIDIYDNCHILYKWFKENVAIGGNSYLERRENMKYIIKELEKYKDNNTYLKKFYKFVKNNTEGLLMFVEDYYYRMNLLALKENLNPFVFKLMWKQLTYNKYSESFNSIEIEILNITRNAYMKYRNLFNKLIEETIRTSSIVENINSLLRPYLDLKKSPNQNFLNLLQLYFNTRKFKRSRKNNKKDKSPLELYTNKDHLGFFEILGF